MDLVKELFGTADLYAILGISKSEVKNEKKLKSAYLKAALKYHPDKAPEKERELYTKRFQVIQRIYDLFKDSDLRKIYDDTGSWPEDDKIELDISSFGRLDANAVAEFKKVYQGSEEERQDIKKYYIEGQGDIFHICDNVYFLNILDDEDRVNSIIESLIEAGEIERLDKGKKSDKVRAAKLKKAKKEAEEAEKMLKEKNMSSSGSLDDLAKAITKRNQERGDSFLDALAQKYGATNTKKTGKKKANASDDSGPSTKKAKSGTKNSAEDGNSGGRSTRSKSKSAK